MTLERGWVRGLAADPDFAAFEVFFFPDGHDFLEAIDCEAAGLEGFSAMRRGDCDRDRSLADFDDADAMRDCYPRDFPSRAGLDCELAHLRQRHRFVSFVLEANPGGARGVAA